MDKNDYADLKDKVRQGIFHAFIPRHLAVSGQPELDVFPYNVLFTRYKVENGKTIMGSAIYEPLIKSYKKIGVKLSMEYFNIYDPGCNLIIIYNEKEKFYKGEKFIKGKSVGIAIGKDWNIFFVHFTSLGLSSGERCRFEELPTKRQN